jgi:hypothetical protein
MVGGKLDVLDNCSTNDPKAYEDVRDAKPARPKRPRGRRFQS